MDWVPHVVGFVDLRWLGLRKGTTDTAACGWLRGFGVVWFERGYQSHIICGWLGGVLEGRVGAPMVAT